METSFYKKGVKDGMEVSIKSIIIDIQDDILDSLRRELEDLDKQMTGSKADETIPVLKQYQKNLLIKFKEKLKLIEDGAE